ncbi:hypothetical protein [Cystobacter fuscus]|uniref:hypothetical protein n=1 Tax=Cystobacter fuscus TaxID=43 RepID=UPI002B2ECD14|nr:hypothetical protein F0U63_27220 [Cystobacter fuscus]
MDLMGPGKSVVVAHRYQAFVCAWFQPKKAPPTVGWLPAVSFEVKRSATPTGLNAWKSSWRYFDNVLDIAPKKGALAVKGVAIWNGGGGNVHDGGVEASAAPQEGCRTLRTAPAGK